MDESPSRDQRYCSNCGEQITRQANYCHYCGEPLERSSESDRQGGVSDPAPGHESRQHDHDSGEGWDHGAAGSDVPETAGSPGPEAAEGRGAYLRPDESPLRTVGIAAGLGVLGIVFLVIISLVLGGVLLAAGASGAILLVVGTVIGQYVGFGGLAVGYLRRRGLQWEQIRSYLGLRIPTLREIGVLVAGYVAIVVLVLVVASIAAAFLPEPADNQAAETTMENPEIVPAMVLVMFLVVGPMEELLYRGIVQNRLRERLSAVPAVAIASAIFAVVHVIALAGSPSGMLVTVFILFFPATVFGAVYEYTGNLVIPWLLHSIHNSVIVTLLFFGDNMEEGGAILSAILTLAGL
jgi:membrane protease YdiL (CAAX protease family)